MEEREALSGRLEDYLATIYSICRRNGVARSKEIKDTLGVSGASVTEACQKLHSKCLIQYAPYVPITLTERGEKIAREVSYKKETLHAFFVEVLGVAPEIADEGACKIEQIVSRDIVQRLVKYMDYLREVGGEQQIRHFLDMEHKKKIVSAPSIIE